MLECARAYTRLPMSRECVCAYAKMWRERDRATCSFFLDQSGPSAYFLYKIGSFDLVVRDVGNTTEIFNTSVSAFSDAKPLINHHVTSKSIISEHRCIFLGNEHC